MQLVERLQALDAHVFNVALDADGGLAVVVIGEGGGVEALKKHAARIVVAALEFVSHHGHFAVQIFLRDEAVDHAIRLQRERKTQVIGVCRELLVIVGALATGSAVPAHAAGGEFLEHFRIFRCAFEHQMFEQMRHAGLAVALVF